uniref:ZP domain-containing protein n=1 Tax=Oryzias latipes TaxID=8090 RepID=A0A3P9IAE2_ORYLA
PRMAPCFALWYGYITLMSFCNLLQQMRLKISIINLLVHSFQLSQIPVNNGRLVFHFDNNNHLCGTVLRSNGTHFIYENDIQSETAPPGTLISRQKILKLCFSCAYPLSQAQSMNVGINPVERMTSYMDPDFHFPFTSETDIEVDEKLYVEVQTEGVDQHQLATILDSCWATPVNTEDYLFLISNLHSPKSYISFSSNRCPNPEDGTVELIQSGISTVARFSFRMFTFTNFTSIFIHCNVHLCLLNGSDCTPQCYQNHRRFKRDLSHYDSQPISFGPFTIHLHTQNNHFCRMSFKGSMSYTCVLFSCLLLKTQCIQCQKREIEFIYVVPVIIKRFLPVFWMQYIFP